MCLGVLQIWWVGCSCLQACVVGIDRVTTCLASEAFSSYILLSIQYAPSNEYREYIRVYNKLGQRFAETILDEDFKLVTSPSQCIRDMVGANEISVTALNNIGISYTDYAIVDVLDIYPPNITCPSYAIVPCGEASPDRTGVPDVIDNCMVASLTYDDMYDPTFDDVCPDSLVRTWTAVDPSGNTASCKQTILQVAPSLTTGSFCSFDKNGLTDEQDFRAVFAPNGKGGRTTFVTTNPTLMQYNLFHFGEPGDALDLAVDIPYPFITLGEFPVRAYQNLTIEGDEIRRACFAHNDTVDLVWERPESASWEQYHRRHIGTSETFEISTTIPESGFMHIAVQVGFGKISEHCSLGLENHSLHFLTNSFLLFLSPGHIKAGRFFADYNSRRLGQTLRGMLQNNGNGPEEIPNNGMHRFGYRSGEDSGFNDLYNTNIVKTSPSRDSPGVGGFVPYGTSGEPPGPTAVYLRSPVEDDDVALALSDVDGYFDLGYLHNGPPATFEVTIPDFGLSSSLKLKNNNGDGFVDFGAESRDGGVFVDFPDKNNNTPRRQGGGRKRDKKRTGKRRDVFKM